MISHFVLFGDEDEMRYFLFGKEDYHKALLTEGEEMRENELIEYVNSGREIEFKWNGSMYSITYGVINGKRVISFCEFDKESTEIETIEELMEIKRNNISIVEMLQSLTEDNIWIY